MNNLLACINTKLLADYCAIDGRLAPLVALVKHWAKQRAVNDPYRGEHSVQGARWGGDGAGWLRPIWGPVGPAGRTPPLPPMPPTPTPTHPHLPRTHAGTLSSYCYVLMCIFLLQTRPQPVLPKLQQLAPTFRRTVGQWTCEFCDDVRAGWRAGQGRVHWRAVLQAPRAAAVPARNSKSKPLPLRCALPSHTCALQAESLRGFGSSNPECLGELLWAFFEYWAWRHNYSHDVVSVSAGAAGARAPAAGRRDGVGTRQQGAEAGARASPTNLPCLHRPTSTPAQVRLGGCLHKDDKDWTRRVGNERHLVCIEDPFEVGGGGGLRAVRCGGRAGAGAVRGRQAGWRCLSACLPGCRSRSHPSLTLLPIRNPPAHPPAHS